jgi:hypothetical protein
MISGTGRPDVLVVSGGPAWKVSPESLLKALSILVAKELLVMA